MNKAGEIKSTDLDSVNRTAEVRRPCFVLAVFERVTNAAVYFGRELWKKSRDSGCLS
jgi:hypothetical protein